MKKALIRLLCLALSICTLAPLAAGCKDPNEPNNPTPPDNPEEQFYIESSLSGWDTVTLCDYTSEDFIAINGSTAEHLFTVDGKSGYKWDSSVVSKLNFYVPEGSRNVQGHYYFEISIYSEAPTDAKILINFGGAGNKVLAIDFEGWRTFRIQTDNITVKNPYPDIGGVDFTIADGSFNTIYLSELKAVNPIYSLSVPDGVDLDDPALYDGIIDTFRELIVGPATPMDNDAYRAKAENSHNNGRSSWALFKETSGALDTPETLFNVKVFNIDYSGYGTPAVNGGRVQSFYSHVYCMAQGYGVPGTELYKNKDLLADIIKALDYGYEFYYGKDIVQTGVTHGNWWEWDIGIPMYLIESLVIISDDVDEALLKKYLLPFDKIVELPPGAACNLVDMSLWVMLSSALQKDAYRLCAAKEMMSEVFVYLDHETDVIKPGDGGFYTDGSFIQHDGTPYAGAYGADLLNAISTVMIVLKDSRFAFNGEMLNRQFEWVLNSYRPFIYGSNFMSFLGGRGTSRNQTEQSKLIAITTAMIKISYYAPDKYKTELLSLIKHVMENTGEDFAPKMQYPLISYCEELKNDTTIPPLKLLDETRVFGAMDRVVQHTSGYAVGIALSSTRIFKYEAINGENRCGWYHGDGMVYLYTDGYDYDNIFYWYADPYLMPGTTVSNAKRTVTTVYPSILNTSPYAGGVAQGKLGAIGFILGYPSNAPAFENEAAKKISAKKSYFTFDNEIVCIGSDIYDVSGTGARTVVENRLWRNGDVLSVNGQALSSPATAETTIDARTMHFTNMGGYVFLDSSYTVLYSKATNSYNGARFDTNPSGEYDFLEISLSHGTGNVSDGKYAYVYLPEASVQETESYDDVVMLRRGSNAHAVLEKNLGALGCVFFGGDKVEVKDKNTAYTSVRKVEATTPCAVMISKGENGETVISAADPTQEYRRITFTVTLEKLDSIVSSDANVQATVNGNTVSVTVNVANTRGASFTLTVK